MKSSLRAGMAGLALLSFVAFLPSCTRDTGNAGKSTTTTTSSSSYQGSADTSSMSMSNTGTSGSNSSMGSPSMNSSSSGKLSLTAHLVDKDELAAQHAAVIEVNVSGIRLVDPDQKGSPAVAGSDNSAAGAAMSNREGHIHYRLDAGPIIATPATRLAFHDLSPGQHTITVMLAGDNHAPLGPQETLTFTVPAS